MKKYIFAFLMLFAFASVTYAYQGDKGKKEEKKEEKKGEHKGDHKEHKKEEKKEEKKKP